MLTIEIMRPPALELELTRPPTPEIEFLGVTVTHLEGDIYDGPYDVTPDFDEQTLETALKTMRDDVTVEAIPVHRTDNPAGGRTIFIGGILNG